MSTTVILNQMLILFILIGTGYVLNKAKIIGKHVDRYITKLILYCTMPMMVLNSVFKSGGEKEISTVLVFFLIGALCYIILPIIAIPFVRLMRIPKNRRGLYMFMFIFGNVGFMGFPIVEALFGSDKILYAGIFNIMFNFLAYSYGVYIMSRDGACDGNDTTVKIGVKTFITPGISISVLSIILYFCGVQAPEVIATPVAYLAGMTTPLAMLVIGSTLAGINFVEVFKDVRVYLFVAIRFFVFPLIIFPLLKMTIKDEFLLQFTFIMLIMPVANSTVLYAKEYGSDETLGAKCVFMSTLLAIVTIPLLTIICF